MRWPSTTIRAVLLATLLLAASFVAASSAAGAADAAPAASDAPTPAAWVEVDGRRLFALRGAPSYPAVRRAAAVAARIEEAARDPTLTPAAIHVVRKQGSSEVFAGPRRIVAVIDLDATAEGAHRDVVAEIYAQRIRQAIDTYRLERNPRYLQLAASRSLAATAVLAVTLWILLLLRRRIRRLAEARYKRRVHDISIQSLQIVQAAQIWTVAMTLLRLLFWIVGIVSIYLYLHYTLRQFPWTRGFAARLLELFIDPLESMMSAILASVPDLIFLALLYIVVRYALQLTRAFFDSVEKGSIQFENFYPDWAAPTYRGLRLLIVLFALVIAYPHIPGSQSEAFKGLSLLLGVMLSIGSSSFVANLIAGYALTYRRVFTIGEWIKIDDKLGQVMHKRLQVTHLRTPKNEEVIVPNSLILSSLVINYSKLAREQGLILHTSVGIGYETPWRQVEAMLLLAAQRTGNVQREPAPFVLQHGLRDFSIEYEINVYCDDAGAMFRTRSELHRHIVDVFNEYGVQIMTPAYESDPEQSKVVPRDQWFSAPARQADVISPLRDARGT